MAAPQEITKVVSARSLSPRADQLQNTPPPPQNLAGSVLHPGRIEANILDAEWEVRTATEITPRWSLAALGS